jgi:hypothetical protein
MRMRASALLLLAFGLAPSAVLASNQKRLPKPIKMVHIRPHDASRLSKLSKVGAKYAPTWGVARPLSEQPVIPHLGHYVE